MYRQATAKETIVLKQGWCKIQHSHHNDYKDSFSWNVSLCDWV